MVVGVVLAGLAMALPVLSQAADAAEAAAAARWLAGRVAIARATAARERRTIALRFSDGDPVAFDTVADGDGDGVSAADVAAGIDPVVRAGERVDQHFPRVRFGVGRALPAIDEARLLAPGDDAVRFGAANQLSLTPVGTASGGTAYLVSRGGRQYAVRISGVTARARVLRYEPGDGGWRTW